MPRLLVIIATTCKRIFSNENTWWALYFLLAYYVICAYIGLNSPYLPISPNDAG